MDLTSGCPFWPINDGIPASYPSLQENISCDVAIIGGGITGALVAWHLVDAGIDVVLLDRRDIAYGSTAASTSLVQYELDTPLGLLIERVGEARAVGSYRICREAIHKLERLARHLRHDCGFERQESLYVAYHQRSVRALQREFALRRQYGFEVDYWTRRKIADASTLPYPAAILTREAAQLDPYRFTHELLRDAVRRGLRVFDRTNVSRRLSHRHGVELRTSYGNRVRARRLVLATGYEAEQTRVHRSTALHSTYALISEPMPRLDGWPGRRLIWEHARPYLYLRTTPENRVIIGGYDEPFRDPRARDRLLTRKTGALARRFRQLFPRMPFEVAYAWTGTFADTPYGLPCIGRSPHSPHTFVALGYGGNGIVFALIAAELIRDLHLGQANKAAELFHFDGK